MVSTPPVAADCWSAAVQPDHFAGMLEGCQVFFLGADLAVGIGCCYRDQVFKRGHQIIALLAPMTGGRRVVVLLAHR